MPIITNARESEVHSNRLRDPGRSARAPTPTHLEDPPFGPGHDQLGARLNQPGVGDTPPPTTIAAGPTARSGAGVGAGMRRLALRPALYG